MRIPPNLVLHGVNEPGARARQRCRGAGLAGFARGAAVAAWLAAGLAAGAAHAASAVSNEEFSATVRALRGQMAADPRAVQDAALLCAYLPQHRAVEEPRCVALRGHFRAEAWRATREHDPRCSADRPFIASIAGCLGRALQLQLG